MFDDPKKELKRLDAELLALAEEEPEEEWDDSEDEEDLTPGRNPAVDFGRMAYADEYLAEDQVLMKGKRSRKAARKAAHKAEQKKKPRKKKRGVTRQLIFGILEIILIILVVRWWLQWNS